MKSQCCQEWSSTCYYSFLSTKPGYGFYWLEALWVRGISSFKLFRIHLFSGTDVVVTVRSSMKALMSSLLIPHFISGPLHCTSADFGSAFVVSINRITKLLTSPFSSLYLSRDYETAPTVVVQNAVPSLLGKSESVCKMESNVFIIHIIILFAILNHQPAHPYHMTAMTQEGQCLMMVTWPRQQPPPWPPSGTIHRTPCISRLFTWVHPQQMTKLRPEVQKWSGSLVSHYQHSSTYRCPQLSIVPVVDRRENKAIPLIQTACPTRLSLHEKICSFLWVFLSDDGCQVTNPTCLTVAIFPRLSLQLSPLYSRTSNSLFLAFTAWSRLMISNIRLAPRHIITDVTWGHKQIHMHIDTHSPSYTQILPDCTHYKKYLHI